MKLPAAGLIATVILLGAALAFAEEDKAAFTTLEAYGGKAFYRHFFGTIDYTPLGDGTTRLTYTGTGDAFNDDFKDMWMESSRCHKNASTYPEGNDLAGIRTFPGILAARYSEVVAVQDGKNLIVDFEYNGGNVEEPRPAAKQDAIFFFDNRAAMRACINDPNRPEVVVGKNGATYATLKLPEATLKKSIEFRNADGRLDNPCRMKLFFSDGLKLNAQGNAAGMGGGLVFFHETNVTANVYFKWQFLPTIYQVHSVDASPSMHIFVNKIKGHGMKFDSNTSAGEKVFYNYNPYAERDEMKKALGFVRQGANFVLPIYGKCSGGGKVDPVTNDIGVYNDYIIYGGWQARTVQNLKCQDKKAGVRFKVFGKSPAERGDLIERVKGVKGTAYPNIRLRWVDNRTIEQDMDDWNWYFVANQYWTGGMKVAASTFGQVNTPHGVIKAGNFADWSIEAGTIANDGIVDWSLKGLKGAEMSVRTVRFFDRVPAAGDVIYMGIVPGAKTLPGKVNDTRFRTWGWAVHVGMALRYKGTDYTVVRTDYCGINEAHTSSNIRGSSQGIRPRDKRHGGAPYHYWEIVLDKPIADDPAELVVASSQLEYLLDGKYHELEVEFRQGDPLGHLFYMNSNVGMHFENVNFSGNIRASGGRYDGKNLYSAVDTAIWRNVYAVNEDGTPALDARCEWQPRSISARQRILKDNKYRFIIDGGRAFVNANSSDSCQVELRNRPTLVGGTRSYGGSKLWNPVTDGKGFEVASWDVSVMLSGGFKTDLSNISSKAPITIIGHGTADLSKLDAPFVLVRDSFEPDEKRCMISFKDPDEHDLRLVGSGGAAGIMMTGRGYGIGKFAVELTDWKLRPLVADRLAGDRGRLVMMASGVWEYRPVYTGLQVLYRYIDQRREWSWKPLPPAPNGFYTVQNTEAPNYGKHILVNGQSMP